jgi:hypothetical protein
MHFLKMTVRWTWQCSVCGEMHQGDAVMPQWQLEFPTTCNHECRNDPGYFCMCRLQITFMAELRPDIRTGQDWIARMQSRRESEGLEGNEAEIGSEDSPFLAEESSEWKCGKACEDTEDSKPDPVAAPGKQRGSTLLTAAPKKN